MADDAAGDGDLTLGGLGEFAVIERLIDACHALLNLGVDRYKRSPPLSLQKETRGGYLELDLLVPEYVDTDEELLKFPWFAPALALAKKGKTVLIQPSPGVNVIVFAYAKVKPPRR